MSGDEAIAARLALQQQIPQLILTPAEVDSRPVYLVSGEVKLAKKEDVMQVVARDGIGQHCVFLSVRLTGIVLVPSAEAAI